MYSNGLSEVVLGKALKELNAPRGWIVIATKVCGTVHKEFGKFTSPAAKAADPELVSGYGLSRKHIFDVLEPLWKGLMLTTLSFLKFIVWIE